MTKICSTYITQQPTYCIVVWTEVLEMAKASVADADEDSNTENHQGEKRRGSQET